MFGVAVVGFYLNELRGERPVFNFKIENYIRNHIDTRSTLSLPGPSFSVLRLGQKDYDGEIHVRVTTVTL